jgi:hypothetical protein
MASKYQNGMMCSATVTPASSRDHTGSKYTRRERPYAGPVGMSTMRPADQRRSPPPPHRGAHERSLLRRRRRGRSPTLVVPPVERGGWRRAPQAVAVVLGARPCPPGRAGPLDALLRHDLEPGARSRYSGRMAWAVGLVGIGPTHLPEHLFERPGPVRQAEPEPHSLLKTPTRLPAGSPSPVAVGTGVIARSRIAAGGG